MKKSKSKTSPATRTTRTVAPTRTSAPRPERPSPKPKERTGEPRLAVEDLIETNGNIDLEPHLLTMRTSGAIARSLKRSADRSTRLQNTPFHSAMGVLNALISHVELLKARLEASKKDLRKLYGEGDEKPAIPNEPTPPQEFGKRRNGKTADGVPKNNTPADNRPRSRPNKVV